MWKARGADPEQCIGRLADIRAIRELKARYFRCMDLRDWAAMYDVFTADAVMDMREDIRNLVRSGIPVDPAGGLIVGRDTIVSTMRGPLEGTVTVHHGHMPEISFAGNNVAHGIWAMEDRVQLAEGAPFRRLHGYGHYHETYVRGIGSRWRIAHLRLSRLLVDFD